MMRAVALRTFALWTQLIGRSRAAGHLPILPPSLAGGEVVDKRRGVVEEALYHLVR